MLLDQSGLVLAHDPTIIKSNGIYYRFQTGDGLPFFSSKDLKYWNIAGKVFDKNPEWTQEKIPGSTSFWAPDIVQKDGWFYVYYSVSTFGSNKSAIGLARNKSLDFESSEYKWEDLGPVIFSNSNSNYNCIDPQVLLKEQTGEEKSWLLFGSFWGGLMMTELDDDGFVKNPEKIINVASRKSDPNPVEGGYIFKKDGWYYLFCSHDFCCRGTNSTYHIVCGRSQNITGPYYDKIGVELTENGGSLVRNGLSFERFAGPGHNSVFRDEDGKIYLVFHAYDRADNGKPTLMIEEISFEDGWPV